jgi:hypothetical protein
MRSATLHRIIILKRQSIIKKIKLMNDKNINMEGENMDTELDLENIESEKKDLEVDNANYDIKTYGADLTLEVLDKKIKEKEIITPEFQRRYVWNHKKASKLIESFLLGLPVPQIFLYREEGTQNLLIVDGQQRLKSIHYFINEKFEDETRFFLRGVKPRWEGKTYLTLDEPDKRRLNNYILRATIFEQINPKDDKSVFEIFERLNTGGMALTEQEIRNCVVRGDINKLLSDLNNYEKWRALINKPNPDSRMKDIEMILRFLALFDNWQIYKEPMKDFISDYMRSKIKISEAQAKHYTETFKFLVDKFNDEIGIAAFKMTAGINVAVFDSLMVGLAIIENKNVVNLKEKIKTIKNNETYKEYVSHATTDSSSVMGRIKLVSELLKK